MADDFEREVLDRLIQIESKIGSWDSAKNQVYDNQREIIKLWEQNQHQQMDIDDLKEGNKWLKRTTSGAVITALVSAIVAVIMVAF